jgi:hypothetical protein
MEEITSEDVKKKRGPGRPRINPINPRIEKKGISDTPSDEENIFELAHHDPMVFKSLFTYFKNIKAQFIYMVCEKDSLTFYARDSAKNSKLCAVINCNNLYWYFSNSTFSIGFNRFNVEPIFMSIDKNFDKISFTVKIDEPNDLNIVLKNSEFNDDTMYKIVSSDFEDDPELFSVMKNIDNMELDVYPVQFSLPSKYFKKIITDALAYSDNIIIEKIGSTNPLQMTYTKPGSVYYHKVFRDDEKIKLKHAVTDSDKFRCIIELLYLKPFSSSIITDEIQILCRENEDILFESIVVPNVLIIYTLVKFL